MKQTNFLFGIHCHQPVENFHHVVIDAVQKSYRPFFEIASQYPDFKFAVHYSGWLLEFIQKKDKKLFELMKKCASEGSIEFFTGGYYEPVLASIPSKDRIGQIKKLNSFIQKNFGQTPKGLWLTERVWDNSIIKDAVACGIEYVMVDDYHFIASGFDKNKLNGYYITEQDGEQLKVFPINKDLRYALPFKTVESVVPTIESINGDAAIVFDDGEKFGIWPKTYEWVYEKGWLKDFLEAVTTSEKIKSTHFGEFASEHKPEGIAYLPTTSYYEMGEWSLGCNAAIELEKLKLHAVHGGLQEAADKFIKGGIWKNFFVKYGESNRLHKRVLEVSKNSVKSKAFEEALYKAETNDVLWHGIFGGLYLPNLRDNAYKFLIEAENIRYKDVKKEICTVADINMDGYAEAKFVNEHMIAIFDSKQGAQLTELSLRDKEFNLQNTLTRRKEAYHERIMNPSLSEEATENGIDTIHSMKIENIEEYKALLKFDWYDKNSFIDHVTDGAFNIGSFEYEDFHELSDFANQPFELIEHRDSEVLFKREGGIYAGDKHNAVIEKLFKIKGQAIEFDITLSSGLNLDLFYLLEFNFHFADIKVVKIDKKPFESNFVIPSIQKLKLEDGYLQKKIDFSFDKACDAYIYKVDTVAQSESGFDCTNQGLCLGFKFPFNGSLTLSGTLKVGN